MLNCEGKVRIQAFMLNFLNIFWTHTFKVFFNKMYSYVICLIKLILKVSLCIIRLWSQILRILAPFWNKLTFHEARFKKIAYFYKLAFSQILTYKFNFQTINKSPQKYIFSNQKKLKKQKFIFFSKEKGLDDTILYQNICFLAFWVIQWCTCYFPDLEHR